jgi:hypothetical protein
MLFMGCAHATSLDSLHLHIEGSEPQIDASSVASSFSRCEYANPLNFCGTGRAWRGGAAPVSGGHRIVGQASRQGAPVRRRVRHHALLRKFHLENQVNFGDQVALTHEAASPGNGFGENGTNMTFEDKEKTVSKVLEASRRKLLDTGTRNRLVHVNRTNSRANCLNIINEHADEVFRSLRVMAAGCGSRPWARTRLPTGKTCCLPCRRLTCPRLRSG